jgi:hypothetical protein
MRGNIQARSIRPHIQSPQEIMSEIYKVLYLKKYEERAYDSNHSQVDPESKKGCSSE